MKWSLSFADILKIGDVVWWAAVSTMRIDATEKADVAQWKMIERLQDASGQLARTVERLDRADRIERFLRERELGR